MLHPLGITMLHRPSPPLCRRWSECATAYPLLASSIGQSVNPGNQLHRLFSDLFSCMLSLAVLSARDVSRMYILIRLAIHSCACMAQCSACAPFEQRPTVMPRLQHCSLTHVHVFCKQPVSGLQPLVVPLYSLNARLLIALA